MSEKLATNTLEYDETLCTGCGMCTAVCPHAVFEVDGGRARIARLDACMECGACELNCPTGAIAVDSGVGCATAMIYAALLRRKEVTCGDSESPCCASKPPPSSSGCCSGPDGDRP